MVCVGRSNTMSLRILELLCLCLLGTPVSCESQTCLGVAECTCTKYVARCQFLHNSSIPKFSSSQNDEWLEIEGNRRITELQDCIFESLKIETLGIRGTGISHLTCGSFKGLEDTLTDLSLRNNFIFNVSACAFSGLQKLRQLDLSYNNIGVLTADSFPELPELYQLFLRSNDLSHIGDKTFAISPSLEELDLQDNSLTSSVWSSLNSSNSHFDNLCTVILNGNPLGEVPSDLLLILPVVDYLTLRNCSLKTFPWENLSLTRTFHVLDLSDNHLTTFGTGTSPVSLEYRGAVFNISFNKLETLNINFSSTEGVVSRRQIVASNNILTTVIVNVHLHKSAVISDVEIDMNDNNIESMVNFSVQTDTDKSMNFTISIDRNAISDVSAFPLIVKLIEFGEVSFWDPCATSKSSLIDINIEKLSLRENTIVNIDPHACLSVAKHVDISGNQLTKLDLLPTALEQRISTLNVSRNRIQDVCTANLYKTLRVLDLSHNLITGLPDFSDRLTRKRFNSLLLVGNPINCDCSVLWTKLSAFSGKLVNASCQTPEDKFGQNVLSVDLSQCNSEMVRRITSEECSQTAHTGLPTQTEEYGIGLVIALAVISCFLLFLSVALVTVLCCIRFRRNCVNRFVSRKVSNQTCESPIPNLNENSYYGISSSHNSSSMNSGYILPISASVPYQNGVQEEEYEYPSLQ